MWCGCFTSQDRSCFIQHDSLDNLKISDLVVRHGAFVRDGELFHAPTQPMATFGDGIFWRKIQGPKRLRKYTLDEPPCGESGFKVFFSF